MSLKSYQKPRLKVGDLVEYVPLWRVQGGPPPRQRFIGIVQKVEITMIQTITPAIYKVHWSNHRFTDKGWYTEGQLRLLSRSNDDEEV